MYIVCVHSVCVCLLCARFLICLDICPAHTTPYHLPTPHRHTHTHHPIPPPPPLTLTCSPCRSINPCGLLAFLLRNMLADAAACAAFISSLYARPVVGVVVVVVCKDGGVVVVVVTVHYIHNRPLQHMILCNIPTHTQHHPTQHSTHPQPPFTYHVHPTPLQAPCSPPNTLASLA